MANPEIQTQEASIVLVGSFNPLIFHPEWFLRNEIVSEVDMEGVQTEIVHPEIARFSFSWLSVEIVNNRFIARANDPSQFSILRDFVISTFAILEHTPVKQLGMNLAIKYAVGNEDDWHKIGDTLAPKLIWEKSLPSRVGLRSLRVHSPRTDDLDGDIKVTIESRENFGVNVDINSHVEIAPDIIMSEILSEYWDDSIHQAITIANTTINEALG